jgi:CCR4-NOT transcription complex subunit 7/8
MESELDAIASLRTTYPYITIDTEYAGGAVHRPPAACLAPRPRERYALVKADVDDVPIVQLGITLCDEHGNIPLAATADGHGGRPSELAWEVTSTTPAARSPSRSCGYRASTSTRRARTA